MEPTAFLDALSRTGVDVPDALARFMGNRDLYLSFLCRLPKALDLNAIRQALRSGQEEDFYARVHELKGMTGNLSVRTLFQPAQLLLEEYRAHGLSRPEHLEPLVEQLSAAAAPLIALIQDYQETSAKGGYS